MVQVGNCKEFSSFLTTEPIVTFVTAKFDSAIYVSGDIRVDYRHVSNHLYINRGHENMKLFPRVPSPEGITDSDLNSIIDA